MAANKLRCGRDRRLRGVGPGFPVQLGFYEVLRRPCTAENIIWEAEVDTAGVHLLGRHEVARQICAAENIISTAEVSTDGDLAGFVPSGVMRAIPPSSAIPATTRVPVRTVLIRRAAVEMCSLMKFVKVIVLSSLLPSRECFVLVGVAIDPSRARVG